MKVKIAGNQIENKIYQIIKINKKKLICLEKPIVTYCESNTHLTTQEKVIQENEKSRMIMKNQLIQFWLAA